MVNWQEIDAKWQRTKAWNKSGGRLPGLGKILLIVGLVLGIVVAATALVIKTSKEPEKEPEITYIGYTTGLVPDAIENLVIWSGTNELTPELAQAAVTFVNEHENTIATFIPQFKNEILVQYENYMGENRRREIEQLTYENFRDNIRAVYGCHSKDGGWVIVCALGPTIPTIGYGPSSEFSQLLIAYVLVSSDGKELHHIFVARYVLIFEALLA